jgi:hypothetical protein
MSVLLEEQELEDVQGGFLFGCSGLAFRPGYTYYGPGYGAGGWGAPGGGWGYGGPGGYGYRGGNCWC